MNTRTVSAPENQNVTFVELFFDLVFVFSVTQVVGLLHGGLDWSVVGRSLLVFWLVWWAWSQYTWALNAADTTHSLVQFGTLVAAGAALFMAIALPGAFGDRSLWFALTYVVVRGIGLILHALVASENPKQREAVRIFIIVSLGGLAAVVAGGVLGGTLQYVLWGAAIVLDIVAAAVGGQAEGWGLHAEHFAERHGLFVIIALGETLIVAASRATVAAWTGDLTFAVVLAVAVTGALWWSYFPKAKPILNAALESVQGSAQSTMARDVYSLMHFPMLCGIIAYAYVVEEIVAHPGEHLPLEGRIAIAAGLLLFAGGTGLAMLRATHRLPVFRTATIVATAAAIVALPGIAGYWTVLAVGLVGILAIAIAEQRG